MATILEEIYSTDKYICDFISRSLDMDRGLVSQAIIAVLRNFVEHIALYEYSIDKSEELENNWESIHKKGIPYLNCCGHLKFLKEFHDFLSISVSHYTPNQDNSERLMLKYYEYLFRTRKYLEEKRKISVLNNLELFPLNLDQGLLEYYKKISEIINTINHSIKTEYNSFYILKKKPFYIEKDMFFEMTLALADDYSSKYDRIIVYTKDDIPQNYAIRTNFLYGFIDIFDMKFPITIINDWEISIRPCELNNFCKFFGLGNNIQKGYVEYKNLMSFLKESGFTLVDLVKMPDSLYKGYKNEILKGNKKEYFFPALSATRVLYKKESAGSNVLLYLLNGLNNVVLKKQFSAVKESLLSNLFLNRKCKPFDDLPFNTALINHIPKFKDLVNSIGVKEHEDELLARHIYNNIEQKGILYTSIKELNLNVQDIDEAISTYNDKLYSGHRPSRNLVKENGQIFIKGYEQDTISIIKELIGLSSEGVSGYTNFAEAWLQSGKSNVDDPDKIMIIKEIFSTTKVAFVYGSAGTGKSTLIDHISNLFADHK
ncbi:MAG: helicase, partial [Ureaplasma sp.]|nr:helicase [Ureaplasma sp.]